MKDSLRARLTVSATLIVGLAVAGFGVGVTFHLYRERIDELDHYLASDAKTLATALNAAGPHFPAGLDADALLPAPHSVYRMEITRSGTTCIQAPGNEGPRLADLAKDRKISTVRIDNQQFRVGHFHTGEFDVHLATSLADINEMREDLFTAYLVAIPLVVLVAAAGSSWLARLALRPVAAITEQAENITADRLSERLPDHPVRDEIGRLTVVLNRMFDRLEQSFHQARRFTADASHGLRTPLTVLRSEIEGGLRAPDCTPQQRQVLASVLEGANRLERITESLLLLSRADAGKIQIADVALDLSLLVTELIEDLDVLAAENRISIRSSVQPGVYVLGDSRLLSQALVNLLENSLKYNETGGTVDVKLTLDNERVRFAVTNTGAGIPPEHQQRLFHRFSRAGTAERRSGNGLGLSIAREIARAHQGDALLLESKLGTTSFAIDLPACAPPAAEVPPV